MTLSPGKKRLIAGVPVALAVLIASTLSAPPLSMITVLIAAIAGLGIWIVFPLLAKRTGLAGSFLDVLICFAGLIVGGLIAGTLLAAPGWGTILGAKAAAALPFQSLINVVLFLAAFCTTSYISRR